MNKTELVEVVASKAEITKVEAQKVVTATLDAIVGGIVNAPEGPMVRGQEKGYFDLAGSTIVLLLAAGLISLAVFLVQKPREEKGGEQQ